MEFSSLNVVSLLQLVDFRGAVIEEEDGIFRLNGVVSKSIKDNFAKIMVDMLGFDTVILNQDKGICDKYIFEGYYVSFESLGSSWSKLTIEKKEN